MPGYSLGPVAVPSVTFIIRVVQKAKGEERS